MSVRQAFFSLFVISIVISRAFGGGPASQPDGTFKVTSIPPSTQPVSEGSVPEAMRRLWTVPRPKSSRESAQNPPQNGSGKSLPYSRVLPGLDPDPASTARTINQPQTQIRYPSRGAPTDEQMNRAFPGRASRGPNGSPPAEAARRWTGHEQGGPVEGQMPWGGAPGYGDEGGADGQPGIGFSGNPFGYDAYDARLGGRDFVKWYNYWNWYDESNARTDRILKNYSGHLAKALELFNKGSYIEAADAFQLACDTHQGDPSARLYTAHAFFAIGRYRDAVPFLHRAYELQPRIIFLGFDIRDDYGRKSDFDVHLAALEDALQHSPQNSDRLLLLGYMYYFSQHRDLAYPLLREAYRLDRTDQLAIALMENSRPPDVMLESSTKR